MASTAIPVALAVSLAVTATVGGISIGKTQAEVKALQESQNELRKDIREIRQTLDNIYRLLQLRNRENARRSTPRY